MAEVVSTVEKLGQLIVQEAAFLGGYRDKVEGLKTEMSRMKSFLEDAESKRRKEGRMEKNWIREIRRAVYEVEDLIDVVRSESHDKRRRRRRQRKGLPGLISRCAHAPCECFSRHCVLEEIERMQKKIGGILHSRKLYGSSNSNLIPSTASPAAASSSDPTSSHFPFPPMEYAEEEDMVGFHDDRRRVISRLLDEEKDKRIICLLGMVGLGKTTLAKKVYRDAQVIGQFDVRHWVTVAQNSKVPELLQNIRGRIIGRTREELKNMDGEQVVREIAEHLMVKKYLIVLDDAWTTEVLEVCKMLPDFRNGSRIMLTTRNREVAKSADPWPHELHFLNEDDSWELLCRKAFPDPSQRCCFREELEDVGRALASNCEGLPLALVLLGGILLNKGPSHAAWKEVEESTEWGSSDKKCYEMLARIYDDLPHSNLKSCFLYITSFPESLEISASKLIDLWIAVGLVAESRRDTLERTARGYLDELTRRCMVQVMQRSFVRGRTKSIRIHDLLRGWLNTEAEEGGFLEVFSCSLKKDGSNPPDECLAGNGERYEVSSDLRSLLAFNKCFGSDDGNRLCFERLSRLRALDLEGAQGITDLPKDINRLIHLRYLGFRNSSIKNVPSSIGDLHFLQTLDARDSEISQLPSTLWRIPTVEKVCAGSVLNPITTSGIETSKSLQVLGWIKADKWIEDWSSLMEDDSKVNLRRLSIASISEIHRESLNGFLGKLRHLSSLRLDIVTLDGPMVVDALRSSRSSLCSKLRTLKLQGSGTAIRQLPLLVECVRNVLKLELGDVKFSEDPMEALGKLPNLVLLVLNFRMSSGTAITCSAGGFAKLKNPEVEAPDVEEWRVESAMPNLIHLTVVNMKNLNEVPQGFQHLANLRELISKYMSEAFRQRIEEWNKLNPHVWVRCND